MTVWRADISLDHVIATPAPDPAITWPPAFGFGNPAFFTYAALIVSDGEANNWVVLFGVVPTDSSLGPVTFRSFVEVRPRGNVFGSFDGVDPFTWGFGVDEVALTAAGAGGYLGGGTLALVKDTLAGTLTLISPLGTAAVALTTNDGLRLNSAANNTPLVPVGFGLSFSVPQDGSHDPEATDSRAEFFAVRCLKDGVEQFNQPLSSTRPGNWFPTTNQSFVGGPSLGDGFGGYNGVGGSDAAVFFVETQLTARYLMEFQASVVTYPSFATGEEWRLFAHLPPLGYSVDMEIAREHGVLFEALPDIDDGTIMASRRSFDNAKSWETWTVFQDNANADSSPTITWYNGRLYVDWHNGTNMVQSRSLDGGRTWDLPVTIPFTGTNPRRLVDRTGGGSYLFYFDLGDLRVVVTYDGAGSYEGPYIVAASVAAQQIDAEFAADGSIVATISLAGVLTQYRSRNLGRTWV